MAEHSGNPTSSTAQHSGSSSEAFTGRANPGETQHAEQMLPGAKPPTSTNGGNQSVAPKGKNFEKNQRKKPYR